MSTVIQYVVDALGSASLYALLALGLALTFGIARIINLAQSELVMVGGYAVLVLGPRAWPIVIVVVVLVVVLLALGMERLVFRPLRGASETTLLVASFGISLLAQNVIQAIASSESRSVGFGSGLLTAVHIGSVSIPKFQLVTIAVTAALLLALTIFFRRSSVGIQLRAAAIDFGMAEMLGARAQRMVVIAFGISGLTAAVASLLLVAQTGTLFPAMGVQPILVGLVATVLGGLGSMARAVLGGLVLGAVATICGAVLPDNLADYQDAFLYLIVIIVLLVRPEGLFVRSSAGVRI
jgi:branched-chain amino acid transport system permease protein